MKTTPRLLFALVLAIHVCPNFCAVLQAKEHASVAIPRANTNFAAALARGDAAALAAMYSSDAMVLPPGSDVVRGREGIRKFWQGAIDAGIKHVTLKSISVEEGGQLACETGIATLAGSEGKVIETVKYVVVWKRENRQWKLHRDMWNSNQPAAAK